MAFISTNILYYHGKDSVDKQKDVILTFTLMWECLLHDFNHSFRNKWCCIVYYLFDKCENNVVVFKDMLMLLLLLIIVNVLLKN